MPPDMTWTWSPRGARHGKASELVDENVRRAWLDTSLKRVEKERSIRGARRVMITVYPRK